MARVRLVRPNPAILGRCFDEGAIENPGDVAGILLGTTLDRMIIDLPETEDAQASGNVAWATSMATLAKPVFRENEAELIQGYLEDSWRKRELLAAFRREYQNAEGRTLVLARNGRPTVGTRWAICGRILSDLQKGLVADFERRVKEAKQRKVAVPQWDDPFEGLPWVKVLGSIGVPKCFAANAELMRGAIQAKPEALKGMSERAWDGLGRAGMDAACAETCQLKDLVPLKDRVGLRADQVEALDALVDDVGAEFLYEMLLWVVRRNQPQPSPDFAVMEAALQDFGASGSVSNSDSDALGGVGNTAPVKMAQLRAQGLWMRGVRSLEHIPGSEKLKYVPCDVCGFPVVFSGTVDSVAARAEHGWQVGKVLGGGWKPGTHEVSTVPVAVCLCCRVEKMRVEDGVRRFGKHPIYCYNTGSKPIPQSLLTDLKDEVYGRGRERAAGEGDLGMQAEVNPGEFFRFGDLSDNLREAAGTPSVAYFQKKLLFPFLALKEAGYSVAMDLPGARHPFGLFGYDPSAGLDAVGLARAVTRARVGLAVARLPFSGYFVNDKKADLAQRVSRSKALLLQPQELVVRSLMEAVREMMGKGKPERPIRRIFELNLEQGGHMRFKNLDILAEAAAWAEAAHPLLCNGKDIYFNRGGATKAMSEAFDQMLRVGKAERVGVGVAALARNLNPRIKREFQEEAAAQMAQLQARLATYAALPPNDLTALRNMLDPMIRAAVRLGVRYTPEQNNFCTRMKRRLNDPDPEAAPNASGLPLEGVSPFEDADVPATTEV